MSEHVVDLDERGKEFMNRILENEDNARNFIGAHELARREQDERETWDHNHPSWPSDFI